MRWTVYSKVTGEILEHRDWPRGEAMHLADNLAATPGHFDSEKFIIRNGHAIASTEFAQQLPPIRTINQEAARRIESIYPIWKQVNILREGDPAAISEMTAYIDAIRETSNRLKPDDSYLDDHHWPTQLTP